MDGWMGDRMAANAYALQVQQTTPPTAAYLPQRLAAGPVLWELSQAAEPLRPSVSSSVEWKHDSFLEGGCEGWVL